MSQSKKLKITRMTEDPTYHKEEPGQPNKQILLECVISKFHFIYAFPDLWPNFGKTDAKAETPILWPPHAKSSLIGKDADAGREEEKGMTEEMVGWHHQLDGHEFE